MNEVVRHPAILDTVESIIGPDILCWSSRFFIKAPGDGGFVSWHQDVTYWGIDVFENILTAWIALSPADAQRLNLRDADQAEVGQETGRVVLQVRVDARVPAGAAWLPAASRETAELGMNFGTLTVKPV